jgi:hypothetical protein
MMPDSVDIYHYRPRPIVDNVICNVHITYASTVHNFLNKFQVYLH